MKRPEPLAHSAPSRDADPQLYVEHVANVKRGARSRAEVMLQFAIPEPDGLLHAIVAAAAFHDLGKLDEDNQSALAKGRSAPLVWDHIDAGVAHLSGVGNWTAAWLARAHHAPGLPARADHFDPDGLGRRLRGLRWDQRPYQEHEVQIRRTDDKLGVYVAAHEQAAGKTPTHRLKAKRGLSLRLALSCLVDADHADTARFDSGRVQENPPEPRWDERLRRLDEHVASLRSSGNAERDQQRRQFYRACREAEITDRMVACEGPVGIGKTLAVTAYLISLAANEGLRRLFVVAPYTNIIQQTAERLREAIVLPGESAHEIIVEHHHRADFETPSLRELAVLWSAPIVVTTAVQFFETLASNRPAQLRKLHALPGSAVFIDEAHTALPAHLWRQNWLWLRELASQWSCRFVFASGSLARFWENADVVDAPLHLPELLPSKLKKPLLVAESQRIRYRTAGLLESVQELIAAVANSKGPKLVILNTVQSAAVVARAFRDAGHDTLHLSTALAPKDRGLILEKIQQRLNDESADWTLVATSCVEAGVDLSFRVAFRERFSTASLIQVGGRVNRHGEKGQGDVVDFCLDEGAGVIRHPGARYSAPVLRRQLESAADLLLSAAHDPSALITQAMADEIRDRGGFGHDTLAEAERHCDYPGVRESGRVIDADTRLVVVDRTLVDRLRESGRGDFRELLSNSVQIWAHKIAELRLEALPGRTELYAWPYEYEPDFLGYMVGVLKLRDFFERDGGIV